MFDRVVFVERILFNKIIRIIRAFFFFDRNVRVRFVWFFLSVGLLGYYL